MKFGKWIGTTVVLLLMLSTIGFGQSINATLGGTVADATGALIPGVMVTITNVGTGIVQTNLTNDAGVYQFPSLQTGTYKVTVELTGFEKQVINTLTLGISFASDTLASSYC